MVHFKFNEDLTMNEVQNVNYFITTTSTLKDVSLLSSLEFVEKALWKYQNLVEAVLSNSSLKSFTTNIPFLAFNISRSLTDVSLDLDRHYSEYSQMVLFGCLCSIADISKSLSTVTLDAGGKCILCYFHLN